MFELEERVIALIDGGTEKVATIVGKTHEELPKYDVRLSDNTIILSTRSIKKLDT